MKDTLIRTMAYSLLVMAAGCVSVMLLAGGEKIPPAVTPTPTVTQTPTPLAVATISPLPEISPELSPTTTPTPPLTSVEVAEEDEIEWYRLRDGVAYEQVITIRYEMVSYCLGLVKGEWVLIEYCFG